MDKKKPEKLETKTLVAGILVFLASVIGILKLSEFLSKKENSKEKRTDITLEEILEYLPKANPKPEDGKTINYDKNKKEIIVKEGGRKLSSLEVQLDYIEKYFQASEQQIAILQKNPSATVACIFIDSISRNENNKAKMRVVWSYLDKNEKNISLEFDKALGEILKASGSSKEKITTQLNSPAKKGSICGFMFSTLYPAVATKQMVEDVQKNSKILLSEIAKFLKEKVKAGDPEAKKAAENFTSVLLNLFPNQLK